MVDVSKYKDLFISESREKLDSLSANLLVLEKNPESKDAINEVFRSAHSIKGMAATMGFVNISKLSHRLESLLDNVRKGELAVTKPLTDLMLRAHSVLAGMIEAISGNGTEEGFGDGIGEELDAVISGEIGGEREGGRSKTVKAAKVVVSKNPFVKIKARNLDELMDISSEMMSLKWRLFSFNEGRGKGELSEEVLEMERLVRELNDKVLSMRMMPLAILTERLPRLVRDIGNELSKAIEIEMSGEAIELDKTIIESLEAPVIHLVRNCVDHGIEPAAERETLGKSTSGNVFFKAFRQRNRVVIEIGDDGAGIDAGAIVEKAVQMGIIRKADVGLMDRDKQIMLVCAPGLSTAKGVSELSGRGVGMDVVKASIESLGGALSIYSELNMGTTFRIDLPLTAAITKAFVVESGGIHYGIPSSEIEGVVEVGKAELVRENGKAYYAADGGKLEKIPFYSLATLLGAGGGLETNEASEALILKLKEGRTAVAVDGFVGMEEVVVRPLSNVLKYLRGISAVTILPVGKPMLILNVDELI